MFLAEIPSFSGNFKLIYFIILLIFYNNYEIIY